MLIQHDEQKTLYNFFETFKLKADPQQAINDKSAKIGQILAYLETIHAQIRSYSKKRKLVLIESGAGNCYLSFLIYYYYKNIDNRPIKIHCLDINKNLMQKNSNIAESLGFHDMHFHACDIADYVHNGPVDVVYSLHACDTATDKTLLLGLKNKAKHIFSVSCCQHTIRKQLRRHPYTGITRHRVFKEKLIYIIGDTLRALLLEMQGYKVDILEFVSSRYTEKNILVRAQKWQIHNRQQLEQEYKQLQQTFHVTPVLEKYLAQDENHSIPNQILM